jgi:two-component system, NarL family, response regulator LiaR
MIRITLINDDEIVRRGVVAMLSRYHSQIEFVEHANPASPQIDIALFDTCAAGRAHGPDIARLVADPRIRRTVVYTWNFQPWLARDVIEQGASGYLAKSLTTVQLVAALQAVHGGKTVVSPSTRTNRIVGGDWPGRTEGLTAREAEVLSLITTGLSNADIAQRMSLSPNSIKSYVRSGYRKIDVTTRSQAVLWGVSRGMGAGGARPTRTPVGSPSGARHVDDHELIAN